jgi:uncharacterized protein YqjF (DUF2071 family)
MLSRRAFLKVGVTTVAASAVPIGCATMTSDITTHLDHRSWPLPETQWRLFMRWHDLLFAHWPVDVQAVRPLIPKLVEIDTFDGAAWIGVVPFRMTGVRPRYVPLSLAFPELNVRTYVKSAGKSAVWFFSLDAASWLSVRAARWLGLPYYDARMTVEANGEVVQYQSVRTHRNSRPAEFSARYRPTSPVFYSQPDTLDHWLTERYALYAALNPERVVFGEIHHAQWPLQRAEIELRKTTMTKALGIDLPDTKPICHFARYQEVVAWPVVAISG